MTIIVYFPVITTITNSFRSQIVAPDFWLSEEEYENIKLDV
jgi:hypothetical protein